MFGRDRKYSIIIDENVFHRAVNRGKLVPYEVGFYMVGLLRENTAYVYDIVEFPYLKQSNVIVSSDPTKLGKIFLALPLGIRIVGTMHKHPDSMGSRPSSIDEETFRRWAREGFFIHVIFSRNGSDVSAYTVVDDRVRKAKVIIRDLSDEKPESVVINIPLQLRLYFHPNEKLLDILNRVERALLVNISKRLLPLKFKHGTLDIRARDLNEFDIEKKAILYVMTDRHDFFAYELVYPPDLKFGDIKDEISKLLNLDENMEFFTVDGKIHDTTRLFEIRGKVIYPKTSLERMLKSLVSRELETIIGEIRNQLKIEIDKLREEICELIRQELVKYFRDNANTLNKNM